MFKFVLCLALAAVALAKPYSGFPNHLGGKIVGGEDAKIEDVPYQVSLRLFNIHFCGASIINEYVVLTAAHCTDGMKAERLNIVVGSEFIKDGDSYKVAEIIQHPKFDAKKIDYDVSILKLSSPIKMSNKISPIALQEASKEVSIGKTGVISGWGSLFEGDEDTPYFLKKTEVEIISHEDCQDAYPRDDITSRMLCARHEGRDSCQGDSGGPFAVDGVLVGVVSWGIGCARPNHPGIYAKVSNLRYWIDANM